MVLWLLWACSADSPAPEPVVVESAAAVDAVFVTIDALRADRVGAYGDPLARTPVLDALAAESVLFREAHAVTPATLPSHASLLTGLYPSGHGLRQDAGHGLADGVPTLARTLSDAGYATAAFVSSHRLGAASGLHDGFAHFADPFHPDDVDRLDRWPVEVSGAETVNAAVAWWRAQAGALRGSPGCTSTSPMHPGPRCPVVRASPTATR